MFNNLPAASYRVFFGNPNAAIYTLTAKNQGNDPTKDSNPNPDGWTDCFNLAPGETNLTIDAGYKPLAPPCNINITVSNIVCDGKGTSSTADDTYTFTIIVTGTNTSGAWTGSFSNAYIGVAQIPPTPYGTPITLGPFPAGQFTPSNVVPPITLPNGIDITVSVSDVGNPNCTANTTVVSPGPCSPPATAALGDFVWNDLNQNGQQDFGEPGVQGIIVRLYLCNGTFLSQTTTSATGFYSFTNLVPNTQYFVEFSGLPTGFVFTLKNAAPANIDSDANPLTGRTDCVFLAPGENNTTIDAGIYQPAPVLGSIGDFVWNDLNKNGIQDTGEPGVNNVTVRLLNCNNAVLAVTTTNVIGFYNFPNLAAGCYRVSVDLPAGFVFSPQFQGGDPTKDSNINPATSTSTNINLAQGENNPTIDAGIYQQVTTTAKVGDFVWFDANGNGIQDPGEPGIPNVFVILENCQGGFVNFAVTNASGLYIFDPVQPGQYRVKFANPGNFNGIPLNFTIKNAGNDPTKDSNADWLGFTDCFTIAPGETNLTIDAGLTGEGPLPCSLNPVVSNIVCNDKGTSSPGDDVFTFTIVVTGTNTGNAGYSIASLGLFNLQYGQSYNLGPFNISGGNLNLVANDNANSNCKANVFVQAPPPCSVSEPCTPHPGVIKPTATPVTLSQLGTATISAFTFQQPFVPPGYQVIYVLTFGPNLIIQGTNNTPNFVVNQAGTYKIHTLVYNPATLNLGIITPGVTTAAQVNALLIQGGGSICAALDLTGATIVVNPPQQTCNNVTNGGTIGYDETQCFPYTPAPIVSVTLPTGGAGALEYIWLSSTTGCPNNVSQAIPGANGASYNPPFISQTTWYVRGARRAGCTDWVWSNCIKKEVCQGGGGGCNITFTPGPNSITIGGLNQPNIDIKVFNAAWQQVFGCNSNCANPTVVGGLPAGTYFVDVQMWNANWQPACSNSGYVTVSSQMQAPGSDPTTPDTAVMEEDQALSDRNGEDDGHLHTISADALKLYPNPASGYAMLEWPISMTDEAVHITLLNQLGQIVRTIRLDDAATGSYRIDLHDLRGGQYMVQFRMEGQAPVVMKLVVAR